MSTGSQSSPRNRPQREGIALCLSGGGFRAALFHLGAVGRLNELGVLSKLRRITSVSGGSVLAAHLADRVRPWPKPGDVFGDWEDTVAAPFRTLASKNLRTRPLVARFLPWNWFRASAGVKALAGVYETNVTRLTLQELPERPEFIFCATDLAFGVNWIFGRERAGDYQAGYTKSLAEWPLARAVAASSCFPVAFNPLSLRLQPDDLSDGRYPHGKSRDRLVRALSVTDGGVYDNMGLEPAWNASEIVLVSDGGATFEFEAGRGGVRGLLRCVDILDNRAGAVRKRWLIERFREGIVGGTYWGVGSAAAKYGTRQGYSEELAEAVICKVRTDMDAFSEAEASVLENHGYLLADAAIQRHVPTVLEPQPPALAIPHPEWMNEATVRRALAGSDERRLLGRG